MPFPTLQTFSVIFWVLLIEHNLYEKTILGIFVNLVISKVTTTKANFRFYKQCSQAAILLIVKLLIKYWTSADLFLIKNITWNGFYYKGL